MNYPRHRDIRKLQQLGAAYFLGDPPPRTDEEAYFWLTLAALLGDSNTTLLAETAQKLPSAKIPPIHRAAEQVKALLYTDS